MEKLLEQLCNIPNKYKPIPFWSWNNELSQEELRKQIRYMKDSGLGGFFIHARTGLKTPYMGEEWYDCISACIDEAIKQNMDVWLYDENGWPSGFVGGEMLKDEKNLCHYLIMKEEKSFNESALACFVKDGTYKRVKGNVNTDTYYNVYDMLDYSNTDIMNPAVVDVFIKETHEEYKKRFGKYFGNVIKGFFTDEPQFSRDNIPYTSIMPDEFSKAYNYDVLDKIIYLFNKDKEGYSFRYDYYNLVSKLYTNNFIKRIYDWCSENNLMITGHTIDETTFQGQLTCTMGVMPFYEYEHIPGIDWLGRVISDDMTPRQVGSVASQLGRSQVLTETFAMTGWNVTPLQLKHILDFLYLGGANLLCQHLMSYSLKGQGKKDHPPTCGYQIPWTAEYRMLNDYATRLGYILANTKDISSTLVLHPIRSGFFTCDKLGDSEEVRELDSKFKEFTDSLTHKGIYHHYGDERIIEHHGKVKDGKFIVGQASYDYVIVPDMLTISKHNLELIKEFIKDGGKIYFKSVPEYVDGEKTDLSYLKSTVTIEDIKKAQNFEITGDVEGVSYIHKISDLGNFLFVLNKSYDQTKNIKIKIKAKSANIIDLNKLCYYNIYCDKNGEYIEFELSIKGKQSLMIALDRNIEKAEQLITTTKSEEITDKFSLVPSDKNIMTLDTATFSTDNGKTFSDKEYYMFAIMEKLLKAKYNGDLVIRHKFNLEDICEMSLLIEQENYKSYKVNGKEVKFSKNDIDIFALSADITDKLKKGENIIEYVIDFYNRDDVRHVLYDEGVKESLKNCLYYDTELESVYLYGKFEVKANPVKKDENNSVVVKPEFMVVPQKNKPITKLVEGGYPFFSGKIKYMAELKKSDAVKLRVNGDIMAYDLIINGQKAGKGVFNDTVDIKGLLNKDINKVEVVATISLRNTLGPHHLPISEPMWVSPHSFTMPGTWEDNKNQSYKETYAFVDSGVDKIELLYV